MSAELKQVGLMARRDFMMALAQKNMFFNFAWGFFLATLINTWLDLI